MALSIWQYLGNHPFQVGYLQANGIRTRYLEAGEGPPLIFLHGTGGHLEAFHRNITAHAQYFRTIAIDMIGHGFSDKPDYDYTLPVYSQHLLGVLDALQVDRVHLSGESLGGWVAAWFALEHPERVNRLVLNTPGGGRSDPATMERVKSSTMAAVLDPSEETVRKRLAWLMFDPQLVTEELVAVRTHIYRQPGMIKAMEHVLCLQSAAIREPYLLTAERLARLDAETLLLWTSHDPTAPVSVGEAMLEALPHGSLTVMQDCGHWPQYEKPDEFNRIHIQFLQHGASARRF